MTAAVCVAYDEGGQLAIAAFVAEAGLTPPAAGGPGGGS